MDSLILTVVENGESAMVVPRRIRLALSEGDGRLLLDAPPCDRTWQASVRAAWSTALRLAGNPNVDARFTVISRTALVGPSAGLPAGLLFLRGLLDLDGPLPVATGGVTAHGMLAGGRAVALKSRAVASMAQAGGGPAHAQLLCPPLVRQDLRLPGVDVQMAMDLAGAMKCVWPSSYARIRSAHLDGLAPAPALVGQEPFAAVRDYDNVDFAGEDMPIVVVQDAEVAANEVVVGWGGSVRWRTTVSGKRMPCEIIRRIMTAARRAAD